LPGCSTTLFTPPELPRPLPTEALVVTWRLQELPAGFSDLPAEQAMRTLLDVHIANMEALAELARKHAALAEWIEGER